MYILKFPENKDLRRLSVLMEFLFFDSVNKTIPDVAKDLLKKCGVRAHTICCARKSFKKNISKFNKAKIHYT